MKCLYIRNILIKSKKFGNILKENEMKKKNKLRSNNNIRKIPKNC